MSKRISFLATGNEIIEGESQDTNGNFFARTLFDLGATIYQHVQVSDTREEICNALRYLLAHSDAVIITGGLGPTSDDNTRYAVAEVVQRPLIHDEESWKKIEERFKKFNLKLVASNRQQALFPEGAEIYPNENGSAPACTLTFGEKQLFMLPGPPAECRPIFETNVIAKLQVLGFFHKKQMFRWLTLGLSESELGEKIDALAKSKGFETGFRWTYPYLEAKLFAQTDEPDMDVVDAVNDLLAPNCVSRERQHAHRALEQLLSESDLIIYLVQEESIEPLLSHASIKVISEKNIPEQGLVFKVETNPKIASEFTGLAIMEFSCQGYNNGRLIYEHQFSVPRRGPEIIKFAKAYAAWQLGRFLRMPL
jgi:isocitrate dehydrogenase